MAHRYLHRRRVEFADTDVAGIMHFSNFFRFMEVAETVSTKRIKRLVDQRIRVLVDRLDDQGGIGRSAGDAPEIDGLVRILPPSKPSKRYRVGEFIKATVIQTQGHDLIVQV